MSILLSLVLVLGLLPGMSLTAYAEDSSYEFTTSNGVLTYTNNIITVTAGYCDGDGFNLMSGYAPVQITAVDGWMITKIEMVCKYVNGPYSAGEITATNGTVTTQGTISKGNTVTIDNINANSTSISRNESGWLEFNQFKIYYGIAHTHSFTYTADGATITVTCNGAGTCDITEGLTLTISAPTGSLVYDGTTTYPATLSTGYNTTAFPGTYSISYKKDGSAYSGVPKDAGTYTASVTAGTGDAAKTASVSYTVTKAAATVTKAPAAKTLTYTGSAQALVDAGTASGGEMQYALGTATEATQPYTTSIPTKTDVGTYFVWYKVVGYDNHNDTAASCITVTISKKEEHNTKPDSDHADSKPACVTATISQAQQSQTPEEQITINKKPTLKKPKPKKNKATITWNKLKRKTKAQKKIWKQIKQIEVEWSTDPSFPKEITSKKTLGKRKTKTNITGLQRKTIYFVRVRYSDGNGGYSRWSKVKRFKTK